MEISVVFHTYTTMDHNTFLCVVFLLVTGIGHALSTDSTTKVDETTKQFLRDLNKETQEHFKSSIDNLFVSLSASFDMAVKDSHTKVLSKIESQSVMADKMEQLLLELRSHVEFSRHEMLPTHVETEVEEMNEVKGTIEFDGAAEPHVRTKIWILKSAECKAKDFIETIAGLFAPGGISCTYSALFVLERNNLGPNADLTLWSSGWTENRHVWNGSQVNGSEERRMKGIYFLITLNIRLSEQTPIDYPSFRLKFVSSEDSSKEYKYFYEVISSEGLHPLSFTPPKEKRSLFSAIVAPKSGKPFSLILKYLDVQGDPLQCFYNRFKIFFLEDSPTGVDYRRLNSSTYRECGAAGSISEPLGTSSSIAIIEFESINVDGSGFKVEVDTN